MSQSAVSGRTKSLRNLGATFWWKAAIIAASFAGCDPQTPAVPTSAPRGANDKAIALSHVLARQDAAVFGQLVTPKMLAELERDQFATLGLSLAAMGRLEASSLVRTDTLDGRPQTHHHQRFLAGEIDLTLSFAPSGKVAAFRYDGELLERKQAEVLAAHYTDLRVLRFVFLVSSKLQKKPNPRGNVYFLGEQVPFGIVVTGIAAKAGQHHIAIDLDVRDQRGESVHQEKNFLDKTFPTNAQHIPRGSLYAVVIPPAVGSYDLRLTIRDVIAGTSLLYSKRLEVVAKDSEQ